MWSATDPREQVDCLVELTWPARHDLWWRARHSGSGIQIAAALDEMALRVGIDPLPRPLPRLVRAPVGYSLAVWISNRVIEHRADTVALADLPAALRAHATVIRTHRLRGSDR